MPSYHGAIQLAVPCHVLAEVVAHLIVGEAEQVGVYSGVRYMMLVTWLLPENIDVKEYLVMPVTNTRRRSSVCFLRRV